jgi:histidine triad (HIT) family protein
MTSGCVVCKIGRGQIPSQRVHEDKWTVAFLDVDQAHPGHVVVAVKPHLASVMDLSVEQAAATFRTVRRVARAVQAAFEPAGLMILQTSGAASAEALSHFHVHVVPRNANDGVSVTWPRKNAPTDELAGLAERIRMAGATGEARERKPIVERR